TRDDRQDARAWLPGARIQSGRRPLSRGAPIKAAGGIVTESGSSVEPVAESANEPALEEAAPTASILPAWLGEAPPEGAFAGLVRIELPEDARPWRGTYDEQ